MNKIIILWMTLFVCTLSFKNGQAQNLGIGDDTPDAMLDVQGEARVSMGAYLILGKDDATRSWGFRADGNDLSITEPRQSNKEYLRIEDDGDIFVRPNGATTMTLKGSNQRVGIGTTAPAQKLEVNGIVRLDPEWHTGDITNRLLMLDDAGDIRANDASNLAVNDAVTYDISGRIIKPGTSSTFNMPGPVAGHTVTSKFIVYTTCNASAIPIVIDFKRYAFESQFAMAYTIGSGSLNNTNSSVMSFSFDLGCGVKTLTVSLNTSTNALTFSMTGGGATGLYIQSGRSSLFRWL